MMGVRRIETKAKKGEDSYEEGPGDGKGVREKNKRCEKQRKKNEEHDII